MIRLHVGGFLKIGNGMAWVGLSTRDAYTVWTITRVGSNRAKGERRIALGAKETGHQMY